MRFQRVLLPICVCRQTRDVVRALHSYSPRPAHGGYLHLCAFLRHLEVIARSYLLWLCCVDDPGSVSPVVLEYPNVFTFHHNFKLMGVMKCFLKSGNFEI